MLLTFSTESGDEVTRGSMSRDIGTVIQLYLRISSGTLILSKSRHCEVKVSKQVEQVTTLSPQLIERAPDYN